MPCPSRRARRRLVAIAASLAVAAAGCASSPPGVEAPAPTPAPASSLASPPAQPAGVLPDRSQTPGAVASTDRALVCASGYSDSVRPPAAYTSTLKWRQLAAGYPGTAGLTAADVGEDHLGDAGPRRRPAQRTESVARAAARRRGRRRRGGQGRRRELAVRAGLPPPHHRPWSCGCVCALDDQLLRMGTDRPSSPDQTSSAGGSFSLYS